LLEVFEIRMRLAGVMRRTRESRVIGSSSLGQWIEAMLLLVLVIQVARLLWALVTPVGLFGDWRAREPLVISLDAKAALFSGFDPFFRSAGAGAAGVQQVTSLPFRLYGIRLNEASGQGSAIIANEAGEQASYAVGDEIAPGITLKSVEFDHVIIDRGGVSETLYIDQSGDAPAVAEPTGAPTEGPALNAMAPGTAPAAPAPGATAAGTPAAAPPASDAILKAVNMEPRTEKGSVTGIVLNPNEGGETLARAGLRPGDIVVQVNGRRVTSMNDVAQLQAAIRPGARISLMVERGGSTVPISLMLPEKQ
jgi:general secretion pathway protein C